MDFVKEFATFLYEKKIIRFGDFTLASGKKSPYYIDLRLVPSFPHEYRKMIKGLQNLIAEDIGFENFHSLVSVPTGGLVVAASLATEIVKPLIYVRKQAKEHGTGKAVEGITCQDMKLLMIEDVVTSGGSVINAIKSIKEEKMVYWVMLFLFPALLCFVVSSLSSSTEVTLCSDWGAIDTFSWSFSSISFKDEEMMS